jgi:hypothetical protein
MHDMTKTELARALFWAQLENQRLRAELSEIRRLLDEDSRRIARPPPKHWLLPRLPDRGATRPAPPHRPPPPLRETPRTTPPCRG